MKTTKRSIILSSCLAIALCVCMITGGTFALFTSESKVNIAVTSGKVEVEATAQVTDLYSPKAIAMDGTVTDATNMASDTAFANGGTATLDGARLTVAKFTPGDKASFKISVQNKGNVSTVYRYGYEVTAAEGSTLEKAYTLYGKLNFAFGTVETENVALYRTAWAELELDATEELACSLELPATATNDAQDLSLTIVFTVEAAQGNLDTDGMTEYSIPIVSGEEMSELISEAEENETITVASTTPVAISNLTTNGVTITGVSKEGTKLSTDKNTITANDVTISNATINGGGGQSITGNLNISGNNTTIENVEFVGKNRAVDLNEINIAVSTGASNQGTTFRNCTIKNAFRGIQFWKLSGDSLIENCVLDNNVYTFNIDSFEEDARLFVKNTTLNGWTSYTDGIELVSFQNCKFGYGAGYAYLRPYSTTTLENCEFTYDSFKLNAGGTGTYTITLTNCTKNGVAITAENVKDLLLSTSSWNANATLIVNGTTVTL